MSIEAAFRRAQKWVYYEGDQWALSLDYVMWSWLRMMESRLG